MCSCSRFTFTDGHTRFLLWGHTHAAGGASHMPPPYRTQLEPGSVLLPPPKGCNESARHAPHLVVSSCGENLTWVNRFAESGFSVTIIDKCRNNTAEGSADAGVDDALGGSSLSRAIEWISLPNLGREAHSYLWYIVHRWAALRPTTVFMQGDAPHHVKLETLTALIEQFMSECWSFVSLVSMLHAATFRTGTLRTRWPIPLATYCALWRSFETRPSAADGDEDDALCPLWAAAGWASFAVARRTVRHRPRSAYERWLRSFEDTATARALWPPRGRDWGAEADEPVAKWGATFFERAWTLVFGCTEALSGCAYTTNTSRAELLSRCPMSDSIAPESPAGSKRTSNVAKIYALVQGEVSPYGCRAMHRLAVQNRTRVWPRCTLCSA